MDKITEKLMKEVKFTRKLDDILENEHIREITSIDKYLNELIARKEVSKSKIIAKAGINHTYAYQILSGERQKPSRNILIQFAIGLNASLRETNRLLRIAGHSELYIKNKRDVIIMYGIKHGYNLEKVEELLYEYNQETICDK